MSRNDAKTRKELIDRALQIAGWNLEDPNQVGGRYRQIEQDEAFCDSPQVTIERLLKLDRIMGIEVRELQDLL